MSDTTTPAELRVPDAAADLYFACGCSESGCSRAGYQSDALPIIVAAELRRFAEEADLHRLNYTPVGDDPARYAAVRAYANLRDRLSTRADELDPQP